MKKVAVVVAVAGAIGVGIALWLASHAGAPGLPSPQNASLRLIGFTSVATAGKSATFCLSNDTPARIVYVLTGFDCKTPDGWITAPLDRTSPHWLEFGDGQGGLLRAGDTVL